MICGNRSWFQITCDIRYTNSTLGRFFYHLFSVIYGSLFFAVRFVVTFERLPQTFQFLKMIHSGYSRSYFNLFLIYAILVTHVNTNLHKCKNSCDSSKDRLDRKILSQFSKLPGKKAFVGPFLSPKNLNVP